MPRDAIKVCIDRILPAGLMLEASKRSIEENPENAGVIRVRPGLGVPARSPMRMALVTGRKWKNGRTLRVSFMGGEPYVRDKVKDFAKGWCEHANLGFEFGSDPDADIRISFAPGEGSWSWIGTESLVIPKNEATMNLGWLTRGTANDEYSRVVLHEFGHAIGCLHEHQNPAASIKWDQQAVYRYYMGPPNNWSKEDVDGNLFDTYARDKTQFTDFDAKSIMIYAIPPEHTTDGYTVSTNSTLSQTDIQFISTAYAFAPKPSTALSVGSPPLKASIGAHGEVDSYEFSVGKRGHYVIETSGRSDVVMTLFAFGAQSEPLAEDDDSGEGTNPRIAARLDRDRYIVRVRHYHPSGKGSYSISIRSDDASGPGGAARKASAKRPARKGSGKARAKAKPGVARKNSTKRRKAL